MRRSPLAPPALAPALLSLIALLASSPTPAHAGIPCIGFELSEFEISPPPVACQYRFNASGTLDELTVTTTLIDCFGNPGPNCGVMATLEPVSGTWASCGCEPLTQTVDSDENGVASFTFSRIGGHGTLRVSLTALCAGTVLLQEWEIPFTSPDLDGSCEASPAASTGVVDLGVWAQGLASYQLASDYDCNGDIGVGDLGAWASGLGDGCE